VYEDVTIQHPRTSKKNTTTLLNLPYILPTSNHILPGRRRVHRRPPAVGWSYLPINPCLGSSSASLFSRWSYPPTVSTNCG